MHENFQNQESFYQTGRTQPPKKSGGLLALVLVVFIFLSGIVSVLGLLNIRLFHIAESNTPENHLEFSRSSESSAQSAFYAGNAHLSALGIQGAYTDALDQLLYRLPQGFYISSVDHGSAADLKGLLPGDVIQSIDGVLLTEDVSLQELLNQFSSQPSVRLLVCRNKHQFFMDITMHPTK